MVVFKTNTPRRDTKREKTTIAEIGVGPVEAHGSNTWLKNVDIPPLPPSNLANCGIIDLDYDLKVGFKNIAHISILERLSDHYFSTHRLNAMYPELIPI